MAPDETMLSRRYRDMALSENSRDNLNKTAENRDAISLSDTGRLVANTMKAWQGSVASLLARDR